jgi:hypothetical protein
MGLLLEEDKQRGEAVGGGEPESGWAVVGERIGRKGWVCYWMYTV